MSVEDAPAPGFRDLPWVRELHAFREVRRKNREITMARAAERGETVAPELVSLEAVRFDHIWAFAKGVRGRPELWEPCIVEAERRKHELADPNSALRQEEWVQDDTDPETYVLDFGRLHAFRDWFMFTNGYFGKESPFAYYWANMIMRGWNRGELNEEDPEPARKSIGKYQGTPNPEYIV